MDTVFVAQANTYFYFQDYIESLLAVPPPTASSCRVEMWTPSFYLQPKTLYCFLQRIPQPVWMTLKDHQKPFISLLNTEQLSRAFFLHEIRQVHSMGIIVFDYSVENIELSGCEHHYLCPFQPPLKNSTLPKTQPVAMITARSCVPRYEVFRQLGEGATDIHGFGAARDDLLFRHKILVNIHFADDYNIHEHMRTDRCVFENIIVVTEPSVHTESLPLRPFLMVEERSKIPALVSRLLQHYEASWNALFGSVDWEALLTKVKEQWWSVHKVWVDRCQR